MIVDLELIAMRIAKIRAELRHLGRLDALSRDEFLASAVEQHATERELQVIIEACLDIGHHVISREGLRRPGDYRDVFAILRAARVIEPDLGRRLEEMAGFRNRLVHGYLDIEPARVYEIARHDVRVRRQSGRARRASAAHARALHHFQECRACGAPLLERLALRPPRALVALHPGRGR